MNSQLFLNIDTKIIFDHIIVSSFNKTAYKYLFLESNWLNNCLILVARKGCGKSLFLDHYSKKNKTLIINETNIKFSVFSSLISNYNSIVLDNLELFIENYSNDLFMLYNLAKEYNKKLIITSEKNITDLNLQLMDLKTRLESSLIVNINQPNKNETKLIVQASLANYQIKLEEELVNYIVEVLNENLEYLGKLIVQINLYIMHKKRNLSLNSLKNIITEVFSINN